MGKEDYVEVVPYIYKSADEARKKALKNKIQINNDYEELTIKLIDRHIFWAVEDGKLSFKIELEDYGSKYNDEVKSYVREYFKEKGFRVDFFLLPENKISILVEWPDCDAECNV